MEAVDYIGVLVSVADFYNRFRCDFVASLDASQLNIGIRRDLRNEPVIATIDELYRIVFPNEGVLYNEEKVKWKTLARLEEARKIHRKPPDPSQEDTFLQKTVAQAIKNLQVFVSNIHISFEEKYANGCRPFCWSQVGRGLPVLSIHQGVTSPLMMSKSKYDHNEVIVEEVLKRRGILLDNANLRLPNLNSRRTNAWKEIRMVVFTKCKKEMSIEQIKRSWRAKKANMRDLLYKEKTYRTGTGGGVDLEVEKAINKGLSMMSETDVQVARSLGKKANFCGLRVAESAVCAVEPASSQQQRESTEKDPVLDEVMRQLSTRKRRIRLITTSKKIKVKPATACRGTKGDVAILRLVLEKDYALCSKLDALLDKISIKLEVVNATGTSHHTTSSRTYEEELQLEGDPNIEESVI